MKRSIFTFLFICCLSSLTTIHAQLPATFTDRLNTVFDSICAKYNIKGASAAMLVPNVGVWKSAYGISHEGTPVTTDMLLGMGSNTKIHISALLLKMQENNLVDLDDTIGEWIHNKPNISGQITIRQLLNHTSGLFDYMQNDKINDSIIAYPGRIWLPEELLALAEAPNFAAGTSWDYSNTNYIIAGIIIQQVLNKPVPVAMHEMILDPQNLNHTFFHNNDPFTDSMPHQWAMHMGPPYMVDLNESSVPLINTLFSFASTAGEMVTTAEDNVQFWHKLISGQIINQTSLHELMDYYPIGGSGTHKIGYGLGIFRYQNYAYMSSHTTYTHGGTFFGFINENMVDSVTGTTISVLTNQDSISNDLLLTRVVAALHKTKMQNPITGINDVTYNSADIHVYPNPANDLVKIDLNNMTEDVVVSVYDIAGRKMMEEKMNKQAVVSVSDLNPGLYMLSMKTPNGNIFYTKKLQVTR